jgi:DNA-binding MurR/RpiR family transcriptional regulator
MPIAVTAKSQSRGLSGDDIEAAKAMLANPDIGVTQIAHDLGVSPATFCRYTSAA